MQNKPGLVRRNGTYYARLRVPQNLREQIGKAEVKLSLRTKDRAEANARFSDAIVSIHRIFAVAQNAAEAAAPVVIEVGRGELEQIARAWFRPRWEAREHAVWKPIPPDRSVQDAVELIEEELARVSSQDEITYGEYLYQARQLLHESGYSTASGTSVENLARYMIRGDLECLKMARRHHVDRDLHHAIQDPIFRPAGASAQSGSAAQSVERKNAVTVAQAIEQFRNDPQRAGLSAKNGMGYETGFKLLQEIVGVDFLLADVERDHARKVQEVLSHLPPNASKRFPKLTLVQAADYAKANALPPISAKTAENQLFNFSSFFRWAVREHIIDRTPADGLQPTQKKRSKAEGRQPFSEADLVNIFSADLYRRPHREVAPGQLGRYWVPLLALYHGARMNELCQLEVADIGEADGVPFMRITEESEIGEEKHLKTRNAQREVPIHPVLQQLGFMEYAAALKKSGKPRLFPDLTKAATSYYSDNFSKWFSRFRKQQGVSDRRVAFHSFRHGFRDATRAVDVPSDIVNELCGWSPGDSMGGHYGSGYPLQRKLEELSKVRFPAVEKLLPLQVVNEVRIEVHNEK
ncbi:site-specific integrase [Ralstonia pseudosolanacearum]|uniref:site-specific integrase n=1 Tax=Ralstonia pseudosolanacearum TaxID=1310165 RepID=UPI002676378B|nr:site-specific integrase [Ralstonia pseudosolanacearum]MDO3517755.1 site-specific integrase [Ralstonia pseudosolanacearum]MDO3541040.1 site-specific integrase [Ralstonia pseudosolanacearum]